MLEELSFCTGDSPKSGVHRQGESNLVGRLIDIYCLILFGAVILSWTGASPHHPFARLLNSLTEPLLSPIRRVLPSMGGLDFSPMVLILGLQFLKGFFR